MARFKNPDGVRLARKTVIKSSQSANDLIFALLAGPSTYTLDRLHQSLVLFKSEVCLTFALFLPCIFEFLLFRLLGLELFLSKLSSGLLLLLLLPSLQLFIKELLLLLCKSVELFLKISLLLVVIVIYVVVHLVRLDRATLSASDEVFLRH